MLKNISLISYVFNIFYKKTKIRNRHNQAPHQTEKLLELAISFDLYTNSPQNSGSESPWRKRDLSY